MESLNHKLIIDGYEYVDLGLPSKTLWATMNVGAENDYDIGLYFRWGETVGYSGGTTSTYWPKNKYNSADGPTELELSNDFVNARMGGGWHMPSYEQILELIDYSNSSRIINYKNLSVNGVLLTSKINGNKIFFPASGCYAGNSKMIASRCYITSKTRCDLSITRGNEQCMVAYFASDVDLKVATNDMRSYLRPTRGVYDNLS